MPRGESRYVCGTCAASSLRWEGQCRSCGNWNTLVEAPAERGVAAAKRGRMPAPAVLSLRSATGAADAKRIPLGVGEFERVLGGGLVRGSVLLLGGEPGVGKSTLVLSLCAAVVRSLPEGQVLYASGEESPAQLGLRAERLGLAGGAPGERISILAETSVERVLAAAETASPALLVVDSIQTLTTDELEGPAGSVGQVRTAAALLQAYAKQSGVPVVLVGHVTKDGSLAGPKTLEHLVDVVLTLEGERFSGLRLLRAIKNRFGSVEEVGVFEMAADGLREVADPAAAFLEPASLGAPGVAVAATLEGSRPLLVEVQALVSAQVHAAPRRTAAGLDPQRLALLIAVLSRRAGVNLSSHDVYTSVVGGLSLSDPHTDLPLALALASAVRERAVLPNSVCCGEIGLTGELRPVPGLERRLREAARLGFLRAIVPRGRGPETGDGRQPPELEVIAVGTLREALGVALLGPAHGGPPTPRRESAVLGSPTP